MKQTLPLLRTQNLTIASAGKTLLAALDWQVKRGEFWCVLGKNGVGKSTLLHTVAGLLKPAGGAVFAHDTPIDAIKPQALALWRGLLMQKQFDAFSSSVLETVMAGRHPHQTGLGWASNDDRKSAMQALQQLRIATLAAQDVTRLSGGERQRVALAALLAQAPQLYLLDEPTSHQDVAAQLALLDVLRPLAADHAVIAAMHDINLVARCATHVLLIAPDRYWCGTVDTVLQPDCLQAAYSCAFEIVATAHGKCFVPMHVTR